MNSSIRQIDLFTVRIPLPRPVYMGANRIDGRDFLVARVETADGVRGWGATFGRGAPLEAYARSFLVPLLLGEDAALTERLWLRMTNAADIHGVEGVAMRAISAIDIALWDWKGRQAKMPLFKLLGGVQDKVPVIVPAGYRRANDPQWSLREEIRHYAAAGVRAVKSMLTPADIVRSKDELAAIRADLGPAVLFGNDFFCTGTNAPDLLAALRLVDEELFDVIEDPFPRLQHESLAQFREAWRGRHIWTGERVTTITEAAQLIGSRCATGLRWDATVCGGVTGWLKLHALASAVASPVVPHCFPEIHAHLVAAKGGPWVEATLPSYESVNFAALLDDPQKVVDGCWLLSGAPGLGCEPSQTRLQSFQVIA